MDFRTWMGRITLSALGVFGLTLLWGRVKAAAPVGMPVAAASNVFGAGAGLSDNGPGGTNGSGGKSVGESLEFLRQKQEMERSLSGSFRGVAAAQGPGSAFGGGSAGAGDMFSRAGAPSGAPRSVVPKGFPRRIVRNGSAVFEVKDYEKARRLAIGIALKHGAEVARDEGTERDGARSGLMAFRVEPAKLDALLRDLEPLGRVLSRSMSMENMTEEYVDLGSRVAAARKVETRLQRLLEVNTSNLEHVLEVERELQRVGTEIETMLGRMKYIDGLAAESTLTVSLAEPGRVVEARTHGVGSRVLDSLARGLDTFITTGVTLLDLTGFLLAVGLWTLPLALGLRWASRKLPEPWRRLE